MNKIVIPQHLSLQPKNQTDYIPKNIQDITLIGFNKKRRAKKAICWLLSITPHSAEEIAEHFEMSLELVIALLIELTKAHLVANVPRNFSKYYLKEK